METRLWILDDLQEDFIGFLQPGDPAPDTLVGIAPIDPEVAKPLDPIGEIVGQQVPQSDSIIDIRRGHDHGDDQFEGIDEDMSLTLFDFLTSWSE
jgi:hypothetical protein